MKILGVHDGHNATAAMVVNGEVVACVSEERFSRLKNDAGYPFRAVEYVLAAAGLSGSDIDYVAMSTTDQDPIGLRTKRDTLFSIQDFVREMHDYWKPRLYENREPDYWFKIMDMPRFKENGSPYNVDFVRHIPKDEWSARFNVERVRVAAEHLGIAHNKIRFVDHHRGHAHYAYYASPVERGVRSAVVTADSWGDGCNATISVAREGKLQEIFRTPRCEIARLYRWMTLLLGMKPNEHEYKVMGLAPYAPDYVRKPVYEILKDTLVVQGLDFAWKNKPKDMYFHFREVFEGLRFDGIAAGVQQLLEDLLSQWMMNILAEVKTDVLCYSGGLAMNVKANKTVAELPGVREIHIPPSGGDESLAIGAAFVLAAENGDRPAPLRHAYLGCTPTEAEARKAVQALCAGPGYKTIERPDAEFVAGLLAEGHVIGRCVGPMEFGARALGNRSILCNPARHENLRLINEKIKFRDFWMPFTPSILEERAADYLVNPKGLDAPFMTLAFASTPLAQRDIVAAMHPYDFSIRPQLVSPAVNPDYHRLIKAFENRTGIGAVLNTSLNLHGSPMVCSATDALETMKGSGLDGMLLPGVMVLKNNSTPRAGR